MRNVIATQRVQKCTRAVRILQPLVVIVAMTIAQLIVALLFLTPSNTSAQTVQSLAPDGGMDLQAVAARLIQIRDVARKHERLFENVRVQGSFVPDGDEFTLVIRDGKCRHDRVVKGSDGTRRKSYWLDDGKTAFSFSNDMLVLNPTLGDRDRLTDQIASSLWLFQMPTWDGKKIPVSEFCQTLVGHINEGAFGKSPLPTLVLRESSTQAEIEILKTDRDSNELVFRMLVAMNPKQNYVMTKLFEWETSKRGANDALFERDVRSEYREIAPGVHFIAEGTWRQKRSGRKLEDLDQARAGEIGIVINAVDFGDFETEANYFDVHYWPPIRPGVKVHDARVQPPVEYVYGKGPFDKEVLERALDGNRLPLGSRRPSTAWLLIGVNLFVIAILGVVIIRRRLYGAR